MEAATGVGLCGTCQGGDIPTDGVDVGEDCGSRSLLNVLERGSGSESGSEEEGNDAGSELHLEIVGKEDRGETSLEGGVDTFPAYTMLFSFRKEGDMPILVFSPR